MPRATLYEQGSIGRIQKQEFPSAPCLMPVLKQPWLCIQCTGDSSRSLSDIHTHFYFCSIRIFNAHGRRFSNLHGFFCHDRGFWAASGGRFTQTPQAKGNWGRMQSPQNQQNLIENLGLPSSFTWSPLRGNILAISEAVLRKIRLRFFCFGLFCLLVYLFIFCYWSIKVHFTLPTQSPSKNLMFL